jgi:hypothetical protein
MPRWDRKYGELRNANIARTKTFVRDIFNSLCDISLVAVGVFKPVPFCPDEPNWFCELHAIISGSDVIRLEGAFSAMGSNGSTTITRIGKLNSTIDEVMGPQLPMYFNPTARLEREQKVEFYDWLLNLDVDARVFRYGCNVNFELITYRKIRWKPKPPPRRKRRRRRARRYRVEPSAFSRAYYDE